jgi:tyrosyl-tRNA synthetase
MPTVTVDRAQFEAGYPAVDLFVDAGLCPSKSEARRLIQQGGAFVGGGDGGFTPVADAAALIPAGSGELVLRAGKKRFCRVVAG